MSSPDAKVLLAACVQAGVRAFGRGGGGRGERGGSRLPASCLVSLFCS